MIRTFQTNDRAAWLAMRRKAVTGSEVGALFGVHRYLTPAQLYAEKSNCLPIEEEDDSPTAVMRRGTRLEPFIASQLQLMHPNWSIAKSDTYFFDDECGLGGTPDYIFVDAASDQTGILEIKTVGMRDFIENWRGGDKDGEIVPEPWQMLQVATYEALTGAITGKIAVMPVSDWAPLDIHVVDIPRNEDLIARIQDKVGQFWRDIDEGIMPDFDFAKDAAAIKAIYANARAGSVIDLTGDWEMPMLLEELENHKTVIKKHEAAKVMIENQIRTKLGDFEAASVPGWDAITLKNTHREGYSVGPADFRTLRIKKSKQS